MRRSEFRPPLSAALALVLGCVLVPAGHASAQPPQPYELDYPRDLSVTLLAAGVWIAPQFLRDQIVRFSCPCATRDVNAFDRGSAGSFRFAPAMASNVAVAGVYALGFALDALDVTLADAGLVSWLDDALVLAQTLTLNGAANELVKLAASRPRPLLYGRAADDAALQDGDNYTSFYSEHTSGAFAIRLAYAQTFALRHPNSPARFALYAAAVLMGSTVAALRVAARKHFPSDVLVGATAGTTLGLLVPFLHARKPAAQLSLTPLRGGAMVTLTLPPL